jgi:3-methylfumaryl-CoA hydratase
MGIMKYAHPATETQEDRLDPARARAFQVALGQVPDIEQDSPLPPFFHQLYFWSPQTPEGLGRDGHPRLGTGLIPDLGLPRRMWAGGRLGFAHELLAGVPAMRQSTVETAEHKHGRSGPLAFVTLRHEYRQGDRVCLTEWQDLVYRQDPSHDTARPEPPEARTDETDLREVNFDSTVLFRYSALTFNGHRIHYDLDYAREVEGYAGLVVHGPLLAQHLMLMARDLIGPLAQFSFRAVSPLMHSEFASLCRHDTDLWVRGPDGRLVMKANAVPRLA